MCLYVNAKYHTPEEYAGYVPKVADRDILVYKVLQTDGAFYYTPYVDCPVYFDNGRAELVPRRSVYGSDGTLKLDAEPASLSARLDFAGYPVVDYGVHAFTAKFAARNDINSLKKMEEIAKVCWGPDSHYILCKAIIPKGSKYFVGEDSDIVTDRLVIFVADPDMDAEELKLS
jgi:hypothetical protein